MTSILPSAILPISALISLVRLEARQHFDPQRPVGEAVAEIAVVLFGEQRRRHQHGDLLARRGGDERGAHRDFGLAEADVAADDAIHRLRRRQVADDRFDRAELVGGFLEWERRGERFVHRAVDVDRQARRARGAWPGSPAVRRRRRAPFGGFLLRLGPLLAAERMQRRGLGRCARIAVDQMQLRDRHVQAVALGVFDLDVFAGRAAGLQRDQPAVAADAMVLVHDRRAFGQLAQVADDRFGLAAGALAAARLAGAFREQLAFGEHRDRRASVRAKPSSSGATATANRGSVPLGLRVGRQEC